MVPRSPFPDEGRAESVGSTDSGDGRTGVSDAYDLLSDDRRRFVLRRLVTGDDVAVAFDELVRDLAAHEADCAPGAVGPERRQNVAIALHHNHLPRLEDHGLLRYVHRTEVSLQAAGRNLVDATLQPLQGSV